MSAPPVYVKLERLDDDLNQSMRLYAAALDLASTSSGKKKDIYQGKAEEHLRKVVQWLRQNLMDAFRLTYQGSAKGLKTWHKETGSIALASPHEGSLNFRDVINAVASHALAPHFEDQAPKYPRFPILITRKTRQQAAQDALDALAGQMRSQQATAVLEALELLDGERIAPSKSQYASYILARLEQKGEGQVVNRGELIEDVKGVEYFGAKEGFRLEPEWLVVLLAALVYSGELVLAVPGKKLDATALADLARTPLEDLIRFKHIERPKGLPLQALQALFEMLGLAPGMAQLVAQGQDEPVQEMQKRIAGMVNDVVLVDKDLGEGLSFWGKALLSQEEAIRLRERLGEIKAFLESLQAYNSPGKLKNFRYTVAEVKEHHEKLEALKEAQALQGIVRELGTLASYLSEAERVLAPEDDWVKCMGSARQEALQGFADPGKRADAAFRRQVQASMQKLKKDYIQTYLQLHMHARLGAAEDKRKLALMQDERLKDLRALATIDLMPVSQLREFEEHLSALKSCFALTEEALQATPVCPDCRYQPALEPPGPTAEAMLDDLEARLDTMLEQWAQTLLANLEDPTAKDNIELLRPKARERVEAFLDERKLPESVDSEFVQALREALSSLTRLTIRGEDLRAALLKGGSPATVGELKERFEAYLDELTKGHEPDKVRIVLE